VLQRPASSRELGSIPRAAPQGEGPQGRIDRNGGRPRERGGDAVATESWSPKPERTRRMKRRVGDGCLPNLRVPARQQGRRRNAKKRAGGAGVGGGAAAAGREDMGTPVEGLAKPSPSLQTHRACRVRAWKESQPAREVHPAQPCAACAPRHRHHCAAGRISFEVRRHASWRYNARARLLRVVEITLQSLPR